MWSCRRQQCQARLVYNNQFTALGLNCVKPQHAHTLGSRSYSAQYLWLWPSEKRQDMKHFALRRRLSNWLALSVSKHFWLTYELFVSPGFSILYVSMCLTEVTFWSSSRRGFSFVHFDINIKSLLLIKLLCASTHCDNLYRYKQLALLNGLCVIWGMYPSNHLHKRTERKKINAKSCIAVDAHCCNEDVATQF